MFIKDIVIPNETGLHARPASGLVQLCKRYQSRIELHYGSKVIDAKSIINLLAGGLSQHAAIQLVVVGEDEEEAGREVASYIETLKD